MLSLKKFSEGTLFVAVQFIYSRLIFRVTRILQFQTFTLLALFYAQIVFKANNSWVRYRTYTVGGYILINLAFFIGFVVSIVMSCYFQEKGPAHIAHKIFMALMYLNLFISLSFIFYFIDSFSRYVFLSILLFFFGYQVMNVISQPMVRITMLTDKYKHIFLTAVLTIMFFSRGIKELLNAFDIAQLDIISPSVSIFLVHDSIFSFFLLVFIDSYLL